MGFPRGTSPAYTTPAMCGASGEVAGGNGNGKGKITSYEQTREERIRQNMERMKQLGLHDLSLKLKSLSKKPTPRSTPSARRSPQHFTALPPPGPRRRSSRLQNSTPVDYAEVASKKKDDSGEDEHDLLSGDGSRPEFYTEEHLKLLGSTEKSWTLFVDGYAEDGRRIYDPVDGKTCHQCRQKTLGHRTNCCKCNKVQGQFCGDCLYMRYGEHVLEANQNPDWICPACRGICNCSLCRQAKGWAPTGMLYKKVTNLGFKSVAHYIIQTRQKNSNADASPGSKVPTSAKRSLPFSDTDQNPHFVDADYTSYLTETMQQADATDGNTVDPGSSGVINNERESNDCSNVPLANNTEENRLVPLQVHKLVENGNEGTCPVIKAAAAESNLESEGAKCESQDVEEPKLSNVEATLNNCLNKAPDVKPTADAVLPADVDESTLTNCLNDATSDVKPAAATDVVHPPSSADATTNVPDNSTSAAATDGYNTRKLRPRSGRNKEPEAPMMMDIGSAEPAVSAKSNRKRTLVPESSPNSIAARLRERRAAARARRGDL